MDTENIYSLKILSLKLYFTQEKGSVFFSVTHDVISGSLMMSITMTQSARMRIRVLIPMDETCFIWKKGLGVRAHIAGDTRCKQH